MYDDVFEQDTVLDYFKHAMTLPDDYRLLRNDPLISHVISINAMLRQFISYPDCVEVEILKELRSLLRKSKYPPILRKNWPRISELLGQAITIYKNMEYDVIAKQKEESDEKIKNILPDALRGQKILKSAREGHKTVHGTRQEKAERWKGYQIFINKKRAEKPHLSLTSCRNLAAKHFGVSPRTIRSHTRKSW